MLVIVFPLSFQTMPKLATAFTPTSVIRKMHETRAEAKMAGSADPKTPGEPKEGDRTSGKM